MYQSSEAWGRPVYLAVCFLAVAILSFVAGSVTTLSDAGPARVVENAYRAGTALYSKVTQYSDPLQFDLWRPARAFTPGDASLHGSFEAFLGAQRTGFSFEPAPNLNTGAPLWATGLAFSGDGTTLAIGSEDGSIVLVELSGDSHARRVLDGWIGSFRWTHGRNLPACDYLDPK